VLDRAELEQVGFVGLAAAFARFDPDRGTDFIAFALPTVQGEIRKYFRDKRPSMRLPRRLQETRTALRTATDLLTQRHGRHPTVAELAAHLDIDEEVVLEAVTAADAYALPSLDASIGGDDTDAWTLADTLGADDRRLELIIDCAALRPAIAALPERDREILRLRFFADLSQAEIGRRLGCSQMHISRILRRILTQLRYEIALA